MHHGRPTVQTSEAFDLMCRPAREYARRVAIPAEGAWARALRIPGLLALLLGLVTSVAVTGRVVASLVVSQAICWSFVPVLQVATGSALIASAAGRRVTFLRALELLFAAHGPWSLWLIAISALQTVTPNQNIVLASAAIPFVWTAWLEHSFSREVLGLTRSQAHGRVLAHQAGSMLLILMYSELGSRLSVRLIGVIQG